MKWFGALLIIGATTTIGYYLSIGLSERPRQIRQFIHSLQMLEAEMMYSQLPLYQIFQIISVKSQSPLKNFYTQLSEKLKDGVSDFNQLWHEEVTHLRKYSAFKQGEIELITQFGSNLGQHNLAQQQKQIRLTMSYLNRELDEAIESRDKFDTMTKTIGFLVGVFIVIIFI